LLIGVMLFIVALLSFQLAVTLLHPTWSSPETDWLRAALAWPELAVLLLVSIWAADNHHPEARTWWILSVALLSYTVARTLWSIEDQILFPNHAPFPSFPDPFFMLQYPFFFLAVILIPSGRPWGSRVKLILDGLLIMCSVTALSWYFLLAPLYLQSQVSSLGRFINLYYPTADLVILFGLTFTLFYHQCRMDRIVLALLIAAILCLITADSWVAWLIATIGFTAGTPPDLFWMAFYLMVPLAALVWLRRSQRGPPPPREQRPMLNNPPLQQEDLKETVRFLFPFVAALLASAAIAMRAILSPVQPLQPMAPILVILGLGLLVIVRQGITLLENAQARRERAEAQANELAMRETNRQMETFLGMASHELKTPLTSIIMGLQLVQRRMQPTAPSSATPGATGGVRSLTSQGALEKTLHQAHRMDRLVNDLLDTSRIQGGRLELAFTFTDLTALLSATVEEQRQASPQRTILLTTPDQPVLVYADAERLGQVVTNYLTNALKYSDEASPVEVSLQIEQAQALVQVRDQGPGIPHAEQPHLWERFHRVPGIELQSGSGVGLGIGLYISKTIIEHHQGQVGLESAPGEGSTFWFTLPLAKPGQASE
jgi:signal transduction histidine kinase